MKALIAFLAGASVAAMPSAVVSVRAETSRSLGPTVATGEEGFDLARASIRGLRGRIVLHASRRGWTLLDVSPKSDRVVFARGPHVYISRLDGSRVRLVANFGANFAAWSPDGQRLALQVWPDKQIWVVNADGTQLHKLSDDALYPSWGPGSLLAFFGDWVTASNRGVLTVANADGSNRRALAAIPPTPSGLPVAKWSPSGRWVAFAAGGRALRHPSMLRVISIDGKTIRTLGPGDSPSWSPDSRRIVFARGASHTSILIVDREGGPIRRLASSAAQPTWAPSGKAIAYAGVRNGHCRCRGDIFLISPNGRNRRRITDEPRDVLLRDISWNRNSRSLLYMRSLPATDIG
jgi:Tol biopolymer transport system component